MDKLQILFERLASQKIEDGDPVRIDVKTIVKKVGPSNLHTSGKVVPGIKCVFVSKAFIAGTDIVLAERESNSFCFYKDPETQYTTFMEDGCGPCTRWSRTLHINDPPPNFISLWVSLKNSNKGECLTEATRILNILEIMYWEKRLA